MTSSARMCAHAWTVWEQCGNYAHTHIQSVKGEQCVCICTVVAECVFLSRERILHYCLSLICASVKWGFSTHTTPYNRCRYEARTHAHILSYTRADNGLHAMMFRRNSNSTRVRIVSGCYACVLPAFCCIAKQNIFWAESGNYEISLYHYKQETIIQYVVPTHHILCRSEIISTNVARTNAATWTRNSNGVITISISIASRWCQSYALVNYNCRSHSTAHAIWA